VRSPVEIANKPFTLKLIIKAETNEPDTRTQKIATTAQAFFEAKVLRMYRCSVQYLVGFMRMLVTPFKAQLAMIELIVGAT
jgi:hypothetical protein